MPALAGSYVRCRVVLGIISLLTCAYLDATVTDPQKGHRRRGCGQQRGREPQGGSNLLDATAVHPESYGVAKELLARVGVSASALAKGGVPGIAGRVGNIGALAQELGCGEPTLQGIVAGLEKPGRDPRDDVPEVVFSTSAKSIDDLAVGMELTGTVRSVFDIGVKQDGLVHISKMAERFVRHLSEVVSVGDNVTVWVTGIDKTRGKISLSMVKGK